MRPYPRLDTMFGCPTRRCIKKSFHVNGGVAISYRKTVTWNGQSYSIDWVTDDAWPRARFVYDNENSVLFVHDTERLPAAIAGSAIALNGLLEDDPSSGDVEARLRSEGYAVWSFIAALEQIDNEPESPATAHLVESLVHYFFLKLRSHDTS